MTRIRPAVILMTLAFAVWMLCHRDPRIAHSYPPCPFYFFTHRYCPGCGSARAFYSLIHADIIGALHYNALLVISLPVLVYAAVSQVVELYTGHGLREITINKWSGNIIVAVVLLYWLLRNIPVYPFNLLAP